MMKKLSVLIVLMLVLTISGVYATWTYTQTTDVADEAVNMAMNLTDVVYAGSYGTYKVDHSGVTLTIDPKPGTTHTTALTISGSIVVTFTPATHAPVEIKQNGVDSTFTFTLSNNAWTFDDDTTDANPAKAVVTLNHTGEHDVTWTPVGDGTFTFTLDAAAIAEHISLGEFVLDTKVKYDAFNAALAQGQIIFTVSDGTTAGTP